jgi:hypothetical protein
VYTAFAAFFLGMESLLRMIKTLGSPLKVMIDTDTRIERLHAKYAQTAA